MSKSLAGKFFLIGVSLIATFTIGQAAYSSSTPPPNLTTRLSNQLKDTTPPMSASDFQNRVSQQSKQNQTDATKQVKDTLTKTPTAAPSTAAPTNNNSNTNNNSSTQNQNYTGFQNSNQPPAVSGSSSVPTSNSSNTNSSTSGNSTAQPANNSGWGIKY